MSKAELPEGYSAEKIRIRTAEDGVIGEINALQNEMAAESRPDLPGRPLTEALNNVRKMPSTWEDWTMLIRDPSGRLAALVEGGVNRTGDNEHGFHFEIQVLPSHRRRGIGTWALAETARAASAAGARLLWSWTESVIEPGEPFARGAGFELALVERESELVLSEVDWEMVQRWADEGPQRAQGYRLEFLRGPYPRELYDDVIAWKDVMNTAPRDDLEMNDDHMTPEQLAEREAQLASSAKDRLEYMARHIESGAAVGGTDVFYEPWTPTRLWQGATAVHPDHRGHALGKWLKAAMLLKVREELPGVEIICTGNAYSNDAMLGINNKLGFKESRAYQVWQAPVEQILAKVGA